MLERSSLQRGMVVRDFTGKRLGTVYLLGDRSVEVRHGLARYHTLFDYDEIDGVRRGSIYLKPGLVGRREGHLGFFDRSPPTTIRPVASEAQLKSFSLSRDEDAQAPA